MRVHRATSAQPPSGSTGSSLRSLPRAAGGPDLLLARRSLLLRRPDALTRLVQLRRDRLHLRRDAVECLLQAQIVAHVVRTAGGDELLDVLVALAGGPQLLADLGREPGQLEVRARVDAARLQGTREPGEELTRACFDERATRRVARRLHERVCGGCAEAAVELLLDLRPQALLDVRAQLGQRVELRRAPRELVVERRQHLLPQLL